MLAGHARKSEYGGHSNISSRRSRERIRRGERIAGSERAVAQKKSLRRRQGNAPAHVHRWADQECNGLLGKRTRESNVENIPRSFRVARMQVGTGNNSTAIKTVVVVVTITTGIEEQRSIL
jgi:hypothetical protein